MNPIYRRYAAYFLPLALQSISQGLTYPLVAMVASRGPGGPINMAGLAQANAVMSVIWVLGAGLITAGMVYGRTREGYVRFVRLNGLIALAVVAFYLVLIVPPIAHGIFGVLLGLTPTLERPAYLAFAWSLPLSVLFYLRNPYQVLLFNSNATGLAFGATVARILLTLALSPLFCRWGWVGPVWAVICLAVPVAAEVGVSRWLARRCLAELPEGAEPPPRYREMLLFSVTLSVGSLFLSLSGFMVGAFIARAPNPELMLPVFYMAMGLAGPIAYGASRLQALTISFLGRSKAENRHLLIFAVTVGALMGVLPLVFLAPGLSEWYFVTVQKLPPAGLPLVRGTALALVLLPLVVALRGYSEGKAAFFKKPVTVLAGQAVYLSVVAVLAFFALNLGLPGNYIGPLAVVCANLAAAGVVHFAIYYPEWAGTSRAPAAE